MMTGTEREALSLTYRILGRLWLRELDAPLRRELATGPLGEAYGAVGGAPPEEGQGDALDADFCQLFLGPRDHLPPYQSVWTGGQFQGAPAVSMRQYVVLLGYEPPGVGEWMLDHLGIQLDVMGRLVRGSHDASAGKNAELAKRFFADHLCWCERLFPAVGRRARTTFYRSLAGLTDRFLKSEHAQWFGQVLQGI